MRIANPVRERAHVQSCMAHVHMHGSWPHDACCQIFWCILDVDAYAHIYILQLAHFGRLATAQALALSYCIDHDYIRVYSGRLADFNFV
jgi:hypothetical protein